jgi:putative DNA primase/helicase
MCEWPLRAREAKAFFGGVRVSRRLCCVNRAGWHQAAAGRLFVLPGGAAFGLENSSVVPQTDHAAVASAFSSRGTLPEWQEAVARYAIGNCRLALFLSAAFAGALLDIVAEPSGGFHLTGKSQS